MLLRILKHARACLILILFFPDQAFGQLVINEIAPSNISIIQNSDGDFSDWLEIFNSGSAVVNLAGYGLTDEASSPYQFKFLSGSLQPGERMIVFASDSNSNMLVDHYEMAVSGNSPWKYKTGSPSLDTNWRNLSFDDSNWSTGNGGIGFGDGDDGTPIPISLSVMMRKTFIADTSEILSAILRMDYDDGFVAYLNGVEIARSNMNGNKRPAWNELATEAHEADMYRGILPDSFYIDNSILKTALRNGTNVLAVETHDAFAAPTDLSSVPFLFFGMQDSGMIYTSPPSWFVQPVRGYFSAAFKLNSGGETVYLFDPSGNIVDQMTYPAIANDHVYARNPDGSNNWCYQGTPTPLATNNSSPCFLGYANAPVFSVASGFYNSALAIVINTNMPGGIIRYTTNGDTPDSTSAVYVNSLIVDSTTTIRAAVFTPGYLMSAVVTNTYFINEDIRLPVFSMSTDSLNLWDYNTGIYVLGPNADSIFPYLGANYWQNWTKPASMQYYDKSKNLQLNFDADIQIYGNYSRYKPQKSFEIELSDKYGINELDYPFINDKSYITKYDKIILRNSGTDWNEVHFRDALMQYLMKDTHTGYVGAEPVVLFLNSSYWGVYLLSEKHNQNWVEANYGYKKDEINFLLEIGNEIVEGQGSNSSFFDLYEYAVNQSPLSQQYYDQIESLLDIQNFTDYFIAETYYNNGDWIGEWTNNIKMWRPKKPGAKWKYILLDTDYGFGLNGDVHDNRIRMARDPIEFSHSSNIFDAMLDNPKFKRYFINRYADLMNTIYQPSNVQEAMKHFRDSMAYDMTAHFAKWGSDTAEWRDNISEMMDFVDERPEIVREQLVDEFDLAGEVLLTVNTYPPGSGRIEISTIIPHAYPWSGIYFNGNPVNVTAIPNPGFIFDHWSSAVIPASDSAQSVTYNFDSGDTIIAYFSGSPAPAKLTISEINYNSSSDLKSDDWIELNNYGTMPLDISEWRIGDERANHSFIFPTGTVIPPGGYLVVPEDPEKFRAIFPQVPGVPGELGFSLNNSGEQIKLFDYTNTVYLSVFYTDQLPWPEKADGHGYTCELTDPLGNLNDGNNWHSGCFGGSPGRAQSSQLATPNAISGDTVICDEIAVQLNASPVKVYSYQWMYDSTDIAGAITDTLITDESGTYNVFVRVEGCTSLSPPLHLTRAKIKQSPEVTPGQRCNPGSVVLVATSPDTVYWYDAPAGNLIYTGTEFMTPELSKTRTFYVHAGRVCPSEDIPVAASIEGDCEETISVYPNPLTGNGLVIASDELVEGDAELVIVNTSGQTMKKYQIEISQVGTSDEIILDEIDFGIYFISVFQNDRMLVTKFVKL